MNFQIQYDIATLQSGSKIKNSNDAMDLLADLSYNHDCHKLIVREEQLPDDFFDLSTGIAGEILQKYTTYGLRLAIVTDFDKYGSKSLQDFIRESNKGKQVYFAKTPAEAIESLK